MTNFKNTIGIIIFSFIVLASVFSVFYYKNNVSELGKKLDDKNTIQSVTNTDIKSKQIIDNTLDFDDISVALHGKVNRRKVQELLGVPDKEGLACRYAVIGDEGFKKHICLYAAYFDKVKVAGKVKHLIILFWSDDYFLSPKAIVEGEKIFLNNNDDNDYITVSRRGITGPSTYPCSFFGEITVL